MLPRAAGAEHVAVDAAFVLALEVPLDDQPGAQLDVVGVSPGASTLDEALDVGVVRRSQLLRGDGAIGEDVVHRGVGVAGQGVAGNRGVDK